MYKMFKNSATNAPITTPTKEASKIHFVTLKNMIVCSVICFFNYGSLDKFGVSVKVFLENSKIYVKNS